jgi:hypothetical protein
MWVSVPAGRGAGDGTLGFVHEDVGVFDVGGLAGVAPGAGEVVFVAGLVELEGGLVELVGLVAGILPVVDTDGLGTELAAELGLEAVDAGVAGLELGLGVSGTCGCCRKAAGTCAESAC